MNDNKSTQKYNMYISFGRNHFHEIAGKIFDSDCLALIECDSWEHGRRVATELFGRNFCTDHKDYIDILVAK